MSVKGLLLGALLLVSAAWPTAASRDDEQLFVDVVDASGAPLADIPVRLLSVDAVGRSELRACGATGPAGEAARLTPRRAFFALPRLPVPPRRLVRVALPTDPLAGVELADTLAPGDRVRVQLAPDALDCAGDFEVRVVDARGQPVAGTSVRLEPTHGDDLIVEDTTSADGVVRVSRRDLARFREQVPTEWREACAFDIVAPALDPRDTPSRTALPPPRTGPVTLRLAPHGWFRVCLRDAAGAPIDGFHARPLSWSIAPTAGDDDTRTSRCEPIGDGCHLLGPIPLGAPVRVEYSPGPLARPVTHEFPPLEHDGEVREVTLTVETRDDRPLQGELPRPRAGESEREAPDWRVSGRLHDDLGALVRAATVRVQGPYEIHPKQQWSVASSPHADGSFDLLVPGRFDRVTLLVTDSLHLRVEQIVERGAGEQLALTVPQPGALVVRARLPPELPPSKVLVSVANDWDVVSRRLSDARDDELRFEDVAAGGATVALELEDFPGLPVCRVEVAVAPRQTLRDPRLVDIDMAALTTSMQLQFGDADGDTASGTRIAVTARPDDGSALVGRELHPDVHGRCTLVVPTHVPWIELTAEGFERGFEPVLLPVRPGPQHVPLIPR